jgi:hypothetical protein
MAGQLNLFETPPNTPQGFRYQGEILTPEAESLLVEEIRTLQFREFEFHGFTGKREALRYSITLRAVR